MANPIHNSNLRLVPAKAERLRVVTEGGDNYNVAELLRDIANGMGHIIESATAAVDVYTVTTAAPSDWATAYTSYYTLSGTIYTAVTGDTAPTWAADTYYSKRTGAGASITPDNGAEYRFTAALDALTISLPETIPTQYMCSIVFETSASYAATVTAPASIIWRGDGVISGALVTAAGKRYYVMLNYDGENVLAAVRAEAA